MKMKVIHNDFAVAWKNAMFAMTDGKDIYVDDNFYNLSDNLKKFVLEHEKGHIYLNHINKFNKCDDPYYDVLAREIEADEYALEHTSIKAAQEFIELLSLDDSKISKRRIINLKGIIAEQNIINSGDEDRINALLDTYDEFANIFGDIADRLQAM